MGYLPRRLFIIVLICCIFILLLYLIIVCLTLRISRLFAAVYLLLILYVSSLVAAWTLERFLEYINAQIIYTNLILLRYFWSLIQYTWFLTGIAKYDIDVGGYMPQYACNGLGRVVVAPRSRGALRGVKRKESSVVYNWQSAALNFKTFLVDQWLL